MTGAVLDRPASLFGPDAPEADRAVEADRAAATAARPQAIADRARATLEDVLARALHDTRANGSAECPVCDARLTLTRAHATRGGCGSRLS